MKTGLTRALPLLTACALACTLPGSTAARVAVTLTGTVGPGFTITLTNPNGSTVTALPPGTYTIHIDDNSGIHNFHLRSADGSVDQSTGVAFTGSVDWTVTLSDGSYHFQCDPHSGIMNGDFTVSASAPPPAEPIPYPPGYIPPADVGVSQTASASSVAPGDLVTFTVVVANHGPGTATGVSLTDIPPPGGQVASATRGTCTGTDTVTCAIGPLDVGDPVTITIVLRASAPGQLVNQASIAENEADPNVGDNNRSTLAVDVVSPAAAKPAAVPAASGSVRTTLTAKLSGSNEVPKGSPIGKGTSTITVNGRQVCWKLTFSGIGKPTASHIHKGGAGRAGPVLVPLGVAFKPSGCTNAPASVTKAILAHPSLYYVNIHTTKYPGGAIRGQLAAAATLTGTVGPGFTISLQLNGKVVKSLKAGTYGLLIEDQASIHSFSLDGPNGFAKDITTVQFIGSKTITVTLAAGAYKYYCPPHESTMFGQFAVT
jgi:uncharacterized repeat protein (TIGR01451 family)